ncbi:MAG: undecaprenyldiphospho-muramoylpentapeptide beta-N-acetylglucosaminyltransferase [Bacteroidales bacterium]|jgi:UDP-N-acetylglucosamine--N-acetylmuramyl-(pentapeptide) pyrophosphoryl-undecaprenol N-acetylglucosamine transferase|nr:undecaprenyldiphospho-muramoylpentapeptide beta-N-acetylglucosaminyltransferase [Bacteroidales bacterium]
MKVIISGGGTGGHIFPAVSIAEELKRRNSSISILFVGAQNRMEMEKIPALGYTIVGLPIQGLQRKFSVQNLKTLINLFRSIRKSKKIIRDFEPDIAIGVGGYASGPVLFAAQRMNIPTLIQEQNSYAGITNKILAKRVQKVCVAYDGMERFFKPETIVFTGNPIRPQIQNIRCTRDDAVEYFSLDSKKKTILIIGGSLGARTLNQSISQNIHDLKTKNVEIIWQTGKLYYQQALTDAKNIDSIHVYEFIKDMDLAFTAADIIISRAGAGTISELCVVGKPCILVPSPNVSEDHQTKNSQALVNKNAALMVHDAEAIHVLWKTTLDLLQNNTKMQELQTNIKTLAKPNAAKQIVNEIEKLII